MANPFAQSYNGASKPSEEIISARVISIILDDTHPLFDDYGQWDSIGTIFYDSVKSPTPYLPVKDPQSESLSYYPTAKPLFPQYKASRRKGREESSMDWNEIFRIINQVREEIRDNLPYKVIHVERCEADDIIGVLTHMKSKVEFNPDPIMIVSADKDFIQLHKYNNVRQYSPMQKKFVQHDNPRLYALEHVLKGDSGDGVPNVLSQDDCFVEGIRQTPVTQKKIDAILADLDEGELLYAASWYRNYQRNDTLINLENTPQELKTEIINKYQIPEQRGPGKVLNYFVANRCKMLIECIEDFNNA